MKDVVLNKVQQIQRCIARAREEYNKSPETFDEDYTQQDAAILNILRACESAIDLANHIIREQKWGIPNSSAESFLLLRKHRVIDEALAYSLIEMVHFRNIIVHQYDDMDLTIVKEVIDQRLDDLVHFTEIAITHSGQQFE